MAKAVGLSHTAISRMWHTFGLQPHSSETFKLSNDPLLVEKVRDIVGLCWVHRPMPRCLRNFINDTDPHSSANFST